MAKVTGSKNGNKGESTEMVPATRRTAEEMAARNAQVANLARLGFEGLAGTGDTVALDDAGMVDKDVLIGAPFIILDVDKRPGSYGPDSYFLIISVVVEGSSEAVKFTDGGKGIHDQIQAMTEGTFEITKPILCRSGLRLSAYDHPEFGPSETYYLSGAKPPEQLRAEIAARLAAKKQNAARA